MIDKRGIFVVIEGLDFTGKTTLIKSIKEKRPNWIYTREPGGFNNKITEEIRNIILKNSDTLLPSTKAYLFAASRAEHVKQIEELLNKGEIVLCDRFIYSSIIYQGFIDGLGKDVVKEINKEAIKNLKPDLGIYIKISEEERIKRAKLRNEQFNDLDKSSFKHNSDKLNLEYYKSMLEDCVVKIVDTSKHSKEQCANLVIKEIEEILKMKGR